MPRKWSKTEAFAYWGAKGKNSRWSWSARSTDGHTVVITLWKDQLKSHQGQIVYSTLHHANLSKDPGKTERIENLIWAEDHCDGRFRVVITVAEDENARPRKIAYCYPKEDWIMKIAELNRETGEFRAVKIP